MNLDLYTLTAFILGILAGVCAGFWLARFIIGHAVERLERKVHTLSDNKFELTGQRASLKQLEQRLDAEAARIPVAERDLKAKSEEISELTAALKETTALTNDLTTALRARKAKVKLLQLEQTKWLKRNKALLMKSEATDKTIAELSKDIVKSRKAAGFLSAQTTNGGPQTAHKNGAPVKALNAKSNGDSAAAPALSVEPHGPSSGRSSGNVDQLASRMEQMESDLQTWFDRVGKLEANATSQINQASGLALLEQVLRGEAENQDAAAKEAVGGQ